MVIKLESGSANNMVSTVGGGGCGDPVSSEKRGRKRSESQGTVSVASCFPRAERRRALGLLERRGEGGVVLGLLLVECAWIDWDRGFDGDLMEIEVVEYGEGFFVIFKFMLRCDLAQ